MTNPLVVDCSTCQVRGEGCRDCLITVLLGPMGETPEVIELTHDEAAAAAALSMSGLIPPLRLVRATEDCSTGLPASGQSVCPLPEYPLRFSQSG